MTSFWYMGGFIAAIAVGWVSAMLHVAGIAPIGIVSLVMGAALGAALSALAARTHVRCRTRLVVGTLVMAISTVFAEHAWLYREFRRQWHEARATSAQVAMFRPEAPSWPREYFAREISTERAALWALDAFLIIAATMAIVVIAPRFAAKSRVASHASEP